MLKNSNFLLPCSHRFFAKNGSNSYGAKSRLAPSRVHLGVKWVPLGPKNRSKPFKITMPQNSNFRLPNGHLFFAKSGSCGYGAKSWWRHPRVNIGANGAPLGRKIGQNHKKNTMPPNSNFPLHRFFAKNRNHGCGAKSRWGPFRVDLGANGVQIGEKMDQNRKKIPCPKIRIFDYPTVIDFYTKKKEVTVMAPNHGGDPLGSILGRMGSHRAKKTGQNRKKIPCPKIRIFDYPTVIDFSKKKGSYGYGAKSQWGPPKVHLGANGVLIGEKMGQNRENLPCPISRIFDHPAVIDFIKKNGSYGYGAKSRWRPSRVHLGANGVPLGPKNGSKL